MNKPLEQLGLEPYFFTLKQATAYLCTSPSTYLRREKEGLVPQPHRKFGTRRLYPRAEIILFAQGNWEPEEGK